jgi:hypothetical protein
MKLGRRLLGKRMVGKMYRKYLVSKASFEDEYYKLQQLRKPFFVGIAKGEHDIKKGRTFSHAEAKDKDKLNKWFE